MREITVLATTLDGLERAIRRVAAVISAPPELLPTYGHTIDFGHPHIEVSDDGLHYVVVERGVERNRKSTHDPHELLFWVFESVTSQMAYDFELHNRIEGRDCRRMAFAKQLELLGMLDSNWQARTEKYHRTVLELHPFDDLGHVRATLSKTLRDKGKTPGASWDEACRRVPLPPTGLPRGTTVDPEV